MRNAEWPSHVSFIITCHWTLTGRTLDASVARASGIRARRRWTRTGSSRTRLLALLHKSGRALLVPYPHPLSSPLTEVDLRLPEAQGHGVIVIAAHDLQLCAGANAETVKILEERPIPFIHTDHLDARPRRRFRQQHQAQSSALRGALVNLVSMRARAFGAQPLDQLLLEIVGDRMLQALCLVMDLIPFHSQHLGQHSLDQMVPISQAVGDLATGLGEGNPPPASYPDQLV